MANIRRSTTASPSWSTAKRSEVDREPLRIVADAFLVGQRELTEPFQ